jgi:hypothetical protein
MALATTRYKNVAADGSPQRLVGTDPALDAAVPPAEEVRATIYNPLTGGRSAPIAFTR